MANHITICAIILVCAFLRMVRPSLSFSAEGGPVITYGNLFVDIHLQKSRLISEAFKLVTKESVYKHRTNKVADRKLKKFFKESSWLLGKAKAWWSSNTKTLKDLMAANAEWCPDDPKTGENKCAVANAAKVIDAIQHLIKEKKIEKDIDWEAAMKKAFGKMYFTYADLRTWHNLYVAVTTAVWEKNDQGPVTPEKIVQKGGFEAWTNHSKAKGVMSYTDALEYFSGERLDGRWAKNVNKVQHFIGKYSPQTDDNISMIGEANSKNYIDEAALEKDGYEVWKKVSAIDMKNAAKWKGVRADAFISVLGKEKVHFERFGEVNDIVEKCTKPAKEVTDGNGVELFPEKLFPAPRGQKGKKAQTDVTLVDAIVQFQKANREKLDQGHGKAKNKTKKKGKTWTAEFLGDTAPREIMNRWEKYASRFPDCEIGEKILKRQKKVFKLSYQQQLDKNPFFQDADKFWKDHATSTIDALSSDDGKSALLENAAKPDGDTPEEEDNGDNEENNGGNEEDNGGNEEVDAGNEEGNDTNSVAEGKDPTAGPDAGVNPDDQHPTGGSGSFFKRLNIARTERWLLEFFPEDDPFTFNELMRATKLRNLYAVDVPKAAENLPGVMDGDKITLNELEVMFNAWFKKKGTTEGLADS